MYELNDTLQILENAKISLFALDESKKMNVLRRKK